MSATALAVSTAFIALCSAMGCVGRRLAGRMIKPGLVQELFFEAIAAAELCACCFELIISEYNATFLAYKKKKHMSLALLT